MTRLPQRIVDYLQNDFLSSSRPYCFLIDAECRLLESWGNGEWCGMGNLADGTDMLLYAPYLLGILDEAPISLSHVKTAANVDVEVHVLPDEAGYYVLLLDSQSTHDALQQKQQAVNELRLLHAQQYKLINRQRELISELVETRSELDHHRKEAERGSENKGRFIAMMSHEFRTPLASIINYSDLASEQDADKNDIQKSIEAISRSARHLTSLVEAVLDDAQLDAGQLELQECNFSLFELLDDLGAMMAPLAAEKGLSFAMQVDRDVPEFVRADEVRLRQILINLLGNAVKYTIEGGVRLTVNRNQERLIITVADTGPGISAEDQEKVFQAFERGGRKSDDGAGLGLTITLRLAKLMGGEISLDSGPGEGCTVSLHVPVIEVVEGQEAATEVLRAPAEETAATKSISILICDDDEDMIALVEHYLHRSGYGLVTSNDSSEAVSKALKFNPDLVLMDCNVPGISGVDAARLLRRQGYRNPIVALTASRLSEEEQQVFTRYFRKPAKMPELLAAIKVLTH
ncbi:MAG: response regulator [Woeseiaceae bacterium]|nr:response regulator [Woeseiaceae bacterium]